MEIIKKKLGIIGISEGNGHPYSWSAIFNGYNIVHLQECPYTTIVTYLQEKSFPADAIAEAEVRYVWTQDISASQKIAMMCDIPHIAYEYKDMIGNIDALLLARDDSENHYTFAKPFLEAGIPVYIDKPLAVSKNDAYRLLQLQTYENQIFTCSALRYAQELKLTENDIASIGQIKYIEASIPKGWDKYAIHVIEPVSQLPGVNIEGATVISKIAHEGINQVSFLLNSGILLNVTSFGDLPSEISICVKGTKGEKKMVFKNSFNAFKSSLQAFIKGIDSAEMTISRSDTLNIINLIELGR